MTMPLSLYNTLSRRKEEFQPADKNNIRMYVCGPTVYDRPHLGNARSVVVYDILFRVLRHLYGGAHISYVRNITDVDDKINARAKERHITIQALTQEVTAQFHEDMAALGTLPPTHEPRATGHIPHMIALIESLLSHGNAYVAENHVLFDVTSFKDYGRLSGRKLDELQAGARIAVESYKRSSGDFVLWKPANTGDDPSSVFSSPWGLGRPGWHIECSAMSTEYLGHDFDLHGGGSDLMFPHHENEIAQSCAAHPHSHFAHTWVHNGFLTVNGEKMSKSLGNFITVKDALDQGIRGEVIRYALLSARYSEPLDWNAKLVDDAKKTLDRWYRQIGQATPAATLPEPFLHALCDDLNLPRAFSLMHTAAPDELYAMGTLLGFFDKTTEAWFRGDATAGGLSDAEVAQWIEKRATAKAGKNWGEADHIRKTLLEQGIILEDRPGGATDWRRS